MSLKRFQGWEPAVAARYDYDDAGCVVGFTSQAETEWDEHEQGWMLALARYRSDRCGQCGGNLAETTAAGNEDRYEPLPPLQCHRCVALSRSRKTYEEQPHPHSFLHIVRLRRR